MLYSPFKFCENITLLDKYDVNRVFCKRLNDWINLEKCSCSNTVREKEVSGEW